MIINRVLGKVVHRTAKEFFEGNLRNAKLPYFGGQEDSPYFANIFVFNIPCRNPFTNEFGIDTSKWEDMSYLLANTSLHQIPIINLTSAKKTYSLFRDAYWMRSVNIVDGGHIEDALFMFHSCYALKNPPQVFLKNANDFRFIFYDNRSAEALPAIEVSTPTAYSNANFASDTLRAVTTKIDTTPIRYPDGTTGIPWWCKFDANFGKARLEHDDVMYLINHLVEDANNTHKHLYLSHYSLSLLSDEEKAIATNKGWSLIDNGT